MKDSDYIGKYVLAGITEVDREDNVIARFEKHGQISSISPEGIVIVNPNTGEEFTLPPAVEHLQKARPGRYHLKSGDDVVDDPDFVSVWTVAPGKGENVSRPGGCAEAYPARWPEEWI